MTQIQNDQTFTGENEPLIGSSQIQHASSSMASSVRSSQPSFETSPVRRPYHPAGVPGGEEDYRYKFYSRVDPSMRIPDHVVATSFLALAFPALSMRPDAFTFNEPSTNRAYGRQSSLVTIFAVWNTMMGTSLLALPWAFAQSGLTLGIILTAAVGALAYYTCTLVIKSARSSEMHASVKDLLGKQIVEFPLICRVFMGRRAEYASILFSVLSLVGAAIVYWVLMSSFLYDAGYFFIHHSATNSTHNSSVPRTNFSSTNLSHGYSLRQNLYEMIFGVSLSGNEDESMNVLSAADQRLKHDVLNINLGSFANSSDTGWSNYYWSEYTTVPLYLLLVLVPLCSIKVPTFFTRLNAFGIVSIVYLLAFILYYAARWGIHMQPLTPADSSIKQFSWDFPSLTGILSLGFFIHNCILSLLAPHGKPQHAVRDVGVAFFLVALTYLVVGAAFYACFPLPKSQIADNFLRNFSSTDPLAFVARLFLLLQLLTVFPLLMYILRLQVLSPLLGRTNVGYGWIMLVNCSVMILCIMFAMFYPKVGVIISITGSLSGLMCLYALPALVHLAILHRAGRATGNATWLFHLSIVFLGCANLISQFVTHFA